MTVRLRAFHLSLCALSVVLGCSWLIEPDTRELRCETPDAATEGAPPAEVCPFGLKCFEGTCQRCEESEKAICDDIDNDCDGRIDNVTTVETCGDNIDNDCDGITDEGFDADGDGYSWCGNTLDPDGSKSIDCYDDLASVNPAAPEICDGRDNNCNGVVDEDPDPATGTLCPAGEMCLDQRCVKPSCAIAGSGGECRADEMCDAVTGTCVAKRLCPAVACAADEVCDLSGTCRKRELGANGSPCLEDVDCRSGMCVDAQALRLFERARVCGQACCTSSDCGEGEQCVTTGTGARSCLPSGGLAIRGATQCANTSGCAERQTCGATRDSALAAPTFSPARSIATTTCRVALPSEEADGATCDRDTDCTSRICATGSIAAVCAPACGHTADCKAFNDNLLFARAYCGYAEVTLDEGTSSEITDYVTRCILRPNNMPAAGATGAACSKASDCTEGGCVGATPDTKGHCSPTCCNNAQCPPSGGRAQGLCRPFAFGEKYEMRCDL